MLLLLSACGDESTTSTTSNQPQSGWSNIGPESIRQKYEVQQKQHFEDNSITRGFENSGYSINMTLGVPYPYKTVTADDPPLKIIGEITVSDFRIFESYEGYPAIEGYEFMSYKILLTFSDDNVLNSGVRFRHFGICYYSFDPSSIFRLYTDSPESDIPGFRIALDPIYFNGNEYEIMFKSDLIREEWVGTTAYIERVYTILVPIGYDGRMHVFYNAANRRTEETQAPADVIDSDSLIIRFTR